jgi:hypothetical protein
MLQKPSSGVRSVSFHELIEAGIAYGWRKHPTGLRLAVVPPEVRAQTRSGNRSGRNLAFADRLEAEGRVNR